MAALRASVKVGAGPESLYIYKRRAPHAQIFLASRLHRTALDLFALHAPLIQRYSIAMAAPRVVKVIPERSLILVCDVQTRFSAYPDPYAVDLKIHPVDFYE